MHNLHFSLLVQTCYSMMFKAKHSFSFHAGFWLKEYTHMRISSQMESSSNFINLCKQFQCPK